MFQTENSGRRRLALDRGVSISVTANHISVMVISEKILSNYPHFPPHWGCFKAFLPHGDVGQDKMGVAISKQPEESCSASSAEWCVNTHTDTCKSCTQFDTNTDRHENTGLQLINNIF